MHLDTAFQDLIRHKLGTNASRILTRPRVAELQRYFEVRLKKDFNPYDPNCQAVISVGFPGLPDIPEASIRSGYLKLTKLENPPLLF